MRELPRTALCGAHLSCIARPVADGRRTEAVTVRRRVWRFLVGWWLTVEILLFDREAREIMREEDL